MLGREHEADLAREACKWQRAATLRAGHRADPARNHARQQTLLSLAVSRFFACLGILARPELKEER
jgi:hypothetical protein